MKFRIFCTLAGSLLLAQNVMAVTKSSAILLDGGSATFNQAVVINFDKLLDGVIYNLSCNISSNNASGQEFDDIQVVDPHNREIKVDGKETNPGNGQVSIPTSKPVWMDVHEILIGHKQIAVRNLDDTDTISVYNCVAKPKTVGGKH